jgi:hypothetical protein
MQAGICRGETCLSRSPGFVSTLTEPDGPSLLSDMAPARVLRADMNTKEACLSRSPGFISTLMEADGPSPLSDMAPAPVLSADTITGGACPSLEVGGWSYS